MTTITINRIRIKKGAILTPIPFTLYYKEINNTTYTLIDSNVYVDVDGYILSSPLPSITINQTGYYQLRAVNDFCGVDYKQEFYVNITNTIVWVEDDAYCEQENPLNLVNSISGFADPANVGYDSVSGRMYIVDWSAITSGSNIYHFDANTITSMSDVTTVGSLNVAAQASIMDMDNRIIYISGSNTSGLIKYNIATNTVSNLNYGTNAAYARLSLYKYGNTIINLSTPGSLLVIIDAISFTITTTKVYSSIPNYQSRFSGAPVVILIANQWWVLNTAGATYGAPDPSIGIYDITFSTLVDTISLPGQVIWTNNAYWRTVYLMGNTLFVYDQGSNQLLTVDINTHVVTHRYTFTNRQGKTNSSLHIIEDPITSELYISGHWLNDANTDINLIPVTYKLDNTNFVPTIVYADTAFGLNLKRNGNTDIIVGAVAGVPVYPSNPIGSSTDGQINIFSKSGIGNNTGTKVVLTLKEVYSVTNIPTGNIKLNTIGDPDYISPYEDLVNCPVTYTQTCPDVIFTVVSNVAQYEYSLSTTTKNNPAINNILLNQVDTVTSAILNTYTIPKNSYQHGYITKIGSNPNRIDFLFKDAANVTLSTCTNFFTIP